MAVPILLNWCSTTDGEKARWELFKNAMCSFKQILETTPHLLLWMLFGGPTVSNGW